MLPLLTSLNNKEYNTIMRESKKQLQTIINKLQTRREYLIKKYDTKFNLNNINEIVHIDITISKLNAML